jgi:glycosidase
MRKIIFTALLLLVLCVPSLIPAAASAPITPPQQDDDLPWWNGRVFYEIFVRSFYDQGGDGTGDLQGLINKLDYLNDGDPNTTTDLGVTGLWLMPVMQSPSYHGYDVIDYEMIEQDYGTIDDFKQLINEAHKRGIVVIVDLVLNHTSNQHPWFIKSKDPDSPYRNWYIWASEPGTYLGPWNQQVWHQSGDQYYYGVFWEGMPDLNYRNPDVTAQMEEITRFWLQDMGVDGFRLDGAKHLIESGAVQENTAYTHAWLKDYHDYVRSVKPEALIVGEVWSSTFEVVDYIGPDLDLAFEFDLAAAMVQAAQRGSSGQLKTAEERVIDLYPAGQYATFLTNHDQDRVMSTLRKNEAAAKVAASLLLTNSGVPFIYYGEEIGMVGQKPDERIRTPMQWDSTENTAGFTDDNKPWEDLAENYTTNNVAAMSENPDSLLNHYRALIHLRNDHTALQSGALLMVDPDSRDVFSFVRSNGDETLLVVINLSDEEVSEYALSLDEGPLSRTVEASVLFGEGDVTAPAINEAGGFEDYMPLPILPPQSTLIIQLAG